MQELQNQQEPTDLKDVLNQEPESTDPESTQEQQPDNSAVEQEVTTEPSKPQENINIRRLREAKEALQKERDEMRKRLEQYEQKRTENNEPEPSEDELVERRHLNELRHELTQMRLQQAHPDIDRVIRPVTVAMLNEQAPEKANEIAAIRDPYQKAVAAYKAIKELNIYKEENPQKKVIQQNHQKPRSAASLSPQEGDSPLHRANAFANGLTDDLKAQLWKEMQEHTGNKI